VRFRVLVAVLGLSGVAQGSLGPRGTVVGQAVTDVGVRARGGTGELARWGDLSTQPRTPGLYELSWKAPVGTQAVEIPPCGNRKRLIIDGEPSSLVPGPAVVSLDASKEHALVLEVEASSYERRVACGYAPVMGAPQFVTHGLYRVAFESPSWARGGGQASVYVPPGYEVGPPAALLVGVHPWNGDHWTYANYTELLRTAETLGVVLLMPNGLGNSLYTKEPEEEVMRAVDFVQTHLRIDASRVAIWGASMGGQGATTIGLHRPGRFSSITSYFGDAKFDVSGYVRGLLPTEAAAHAVNPIDVIDNARHLPVWLIHGDADKTAPVSESDALNDALKARGYTVRYDREVGRGHEGSLVAKHVAEIVRRAASTQAPRFPSRVTFRSVRPQDTEAYGVTIERAAPGDAFVDIEYTGASIKMHSTLNLRTVTLAQGALGAPQGTPLAPPSSVPVSWR
jgi:S-formylglutathione hydrolase FrmB